MPSGATAAEREGEKGSPPSWQPVTGQHLYLKGTGRRWVNQHFGAVVVDVRVEDASAKVRYTDGGFKRFKVAELAALATELHEAPERWEEWHSALPQKQVSELSRLHDEIMLAQRAGDAERTRGLQERFQVLSAREDAVNGLQARLRDAVTAGDYLIAHKVQLEINELQGRPASELGSPQAATTGSNKASAELAMKQEEESELALLLQHCAHKALGGGLAGAGAMVFQVLSLMWLRTTMNYQYRYGTSMTKAMQTLYADGGVTRFYRGMAPALLQGPMARFTDTACNAGVLALFEGTEAKTWPIYVKTVFASASASTLRIGLLPLDTVKTVMQVEGRDGLLLLAKKYRSGGAPIFFHGAMATWAASFVSHYPWFMVFNTLNEVLPNYPDRKLRLLRNAGIGLCASICSDTVVNSLRVVKVYRQTHASLSYQNIVRNVVAADGVLGLFSRGLKTRIITNGLSGVMFSVTYRIFEEEMARI